MLLHRQLNGLFWLSADDFGPYGECPLIPRMGTEDNPDVSAIKEAADQSEE